MSAIASSPSSARIEWELLPSLRAAVRNRLRRVEPSWQDTIASEFDQECVSTPFEEVVPGLEVREVSEPEIFAFFFGHVDRRGASANS
jgi:hypothetical protein